jgi:phage FluMu protein Com
MKIYTYNKKYNYWKQSIVKENRKNIMREYIDLNDIQKIECNKCGIIFSNEDNAFDIKYIPYRYSYGLMSDDYPEHLELKCPACEYNIEFKTKG